MIATIDFSSLVISLCAVLLLWVASLRNGFLKRHLLVLTLLIFDYGLYFLLMYLKWSQFVIHLEYFENIIGVLIPLTWIFLFYSFIQKAIQGELKKSEANLQITIESLGDGVISTDKNGKIIQCNPVAQNLIGRNLSEVSGKPLDEVFVLKDFNTSEPVTVPISDVIKNGKKLFLKEKILVSKDGSEYIINDSLAPIINRDAEVTGVVIVFRDVTMESKIQEQLLHSRKMDAVGQLAAGVAHDFNNMLTGILGSAEVLKIRQKGSENQHLIDNIIDAAKRSADLTDRLLGFSRKKARENVEIDVHQVIDKCIAILTRTINKKIVIKNECYSIRSHVWGDPSEIENIFLNLGINSADAMLSGGILSFITEEIELTEETVQNYPFGVSPGAYISIKVVDTGTGIPPQFLEKIFEPFFTTKDEGKGTGLGLAAVYSGTRANNGTVTVHSKPGVGTEFQLFFPIFGTESWDPYVDGNRTRIVYGEGRILLIDDEDVVRAATIELLSEIGYKVVAISDPQIGLQIFQERADYFDMVIIDMIMPDMSGRDLFHSLKKISPSIPVVLISGYHKSEDLQIITENGLHGYLSKPYDLQNLSQFVADVLGRSKKS
jgi:two-component system cell cycle sensor histidine kinase/response regulator CckA